MDSSPYACLDSMFSRASEARRSLSRIDVQGRGSLRVAQTELYRLDVLMAGNEQRCRGVPQSVAGDQRQLLPLGSVRIIAVDGIPQQMVGSVVKRHGVVQDREVLMLDDLRQNGSVITLHQNFYCLVRQTEVRTDQSYVRLPTGCFSHQTREWASETFSPLSVSFLQTFGAFCGRIKEKRMEE